MSKKNLSIMERLSILSYQLERVTDEDLIAELDILLADVYGKICVINLTAQKAATYNDTATMERSLKIISAIAEKISPVKHV